MSSPPLAPSPDDTPLPESGPPPTTSRAMLRLLGHRQFGPYFWGNLLSNCGTWFQNLAAIILVFRLTNSVVLVGVVNFAQFAAVVALAPWVGGAADRFDRRKLLILTQVAGFVVSAALAALSAAGLAGTGVLIALSLIMGVTIAFSTPAMQALVPALVEPPLLTGALALNAVTFNLARAIGPVLAAVVIAKLSFTWAFALNAGSYALYSLLLLAVRPRPIGARPTHRPRLRESLVLVRNDRRLAMLLGIVAVVGMTQDPVSTLTAPFAKDVFHRSDTVSGFLIGCFGAGAVIAAFTVAARMGPSTKRLALMLAVEGGGVAAFALMPVVWGAAIAFVIGGFGYLAANTAAMTAIQSEVDERQRGRVMTLWSIAFLGFRPPGSLIDAAIAHGFGLRSAGVVFSLPALVAAGVLLTLGSRARRAAPVP
jgi:MFS family permease